MSALLHFASWCCNIVFPVPNPPGIIAVPPFDIGNTESITLCPVVNNWLTGSLFLYGLPFLTGHFWYIQISFIVPSSVSTFAIISFTVYSPSGIISIIFPSILFGIIILFVILFVSSTFPIIEQASTSSPTFIVGINFHFFSKLILGMFSPLLIKSPDIFLKLSSGLCIPSNIFPIIPGPRVRDNWFPVVSTGSYILSPVVSSYTCIVAISFSSFITSPKILFSPT